ncbi:hypothetical protein H6F89_27130 [Cyanobacteria bacterium FACHB-63]|nr:hypothetical protein [Cyanobacteria bacterium FACHB-63]
MNPEEAAHHELFARLESLCKSSDDAQRNAAIEACLIAGWQILFEALNV